MEENFSRIEDYINNSLNELEKNNFEQELKNNSELLERYNFYKNIKHQQVADFQIINYDKKILPEINNINFTEKNHNTGSKKGPAVGVLILFIAVSSYLFLSNQFNKDKFAEMQLKNDSIELVNRKYANVAHTQSSTEQNVAEGMRENMERLKKSLDEKEQEITLLKSDNADAKNVALSNEIETLKKELSKVKQEYYENAGQYASDETYSTKNESLVESIRFRKINSDLKITWSSKNSYKLEIFNPDKTLLKASSDFVKNEWRFSKPENGFYLLNFTLQSGEKTELLLEINKNIKIWLPGK